MLKNLSASWKLLAKRAAAEESEIAALVKIVGDIPNEYLALVGEATEIELLHANGQYLRIWGPAGCREMDQAYDIRRRIPGALPIGDDGGGSVLMYAVGHNGFGVYKVGFGCLDADELNWVGVSLCELLGIAVP